MQSSTSEVELAAGRSGLNDDLFAKELSSYLKESGSDLIGEHSTEQKQARVPENILRLLECPISMVQLCQIAPDFTQYHN